MRKEKNNAKNIQRSGVRVCKAENVKEKLQDSKNSGQSTEAMKS